MHPEVEYIGLLTLLYAGTTSLLSYGYSRKFKSSIVKNLITRSKSAGNNFIYNILKIGTSETLRDETVKTDDNKIKLVSVHVPTHLKPGTVKEFGHYLAGLIDGAGELNPSNLVITLDILDISLAYYIRTRLGYGRVTKDIKNNTVILTVTKGLEQVINLINGKFRSEQINNTIFYIGTNEITLTKNSDSNLENHWLAGFSDALASFHIELPSPNNKTGGVGLKYQIVLDRVNNSTTQNLLILIREVLGGDVGSHYYESSSFASNKKVIKYLDHYHLLSRKQVNYLKWRKAYLIVQNKDHLLESGLRKITNFKNSLIQFKIKS